MYSFDDEPAVIFPNGFVMYGAMYVDIPMPDISTDQNVPEIARTGGSSTGSDPKIGKGKIENFTYTVYRGSWNKMPDFSKLKPHQSGKASSGIADPGLAGLSENFGMVFEGEINIGKKGTYDFSLGINFAFPWALVSVSSSHSFNDYKKEDTSIDSNIIRSDYSDTFGVSLTKAIGDFFPMIDPNRSLFMNFNYEEVESESNILNYDYEKDSFSVGLSKAVKLN